MVEGTSRKSGGRLVEILDGDFMVLVLGQVW